MSRLTVSFLSLGCRVNQYEIRRFMERLGSKVEIIPFGQPADVTIIDSCVVTQTAERDTRQMVHRARRFSPDGLIILTGCYVDIHPQTSRELEPGVFVFTREEKDTIPTWIEERFHLHFDQCENKNYSIQALWPSAGRPPLVVQTGCDRRCAYCIIPLARGPSVSRPLPEILSDITRYFQDSVAEVVLSGINLGAWGADLHPRMKLADLLELLLETIPPGRRLRLGSLEPETIDDDLLQFVNHPRLAPHFHIPLQGTTHAVLQAMGRPVDIASYRAIIEKLRARVLGCALGADVIVGFPGETDELFEEGLAFVEECNFSYLHVFPFSPRPGTRAATLPQLPSHVVRTRAARMRALAAHMHENFLHIWENKTVLVAVEKTHENGVAEGMADRFFPVRFLLANHCPSHLVPVRLERRQGEGFWGMSL